MKILFNCINNVVGGGVQNSANFISFAVKDAENDYVFMVSPSVNSILVSWGIEHDFIIVFDKRKKVVSTQAKVRRIEKRFAPDVVYTMAGPSFVFFRSFHVLGTSDPYITHAKLHLFFMNKSKLRGMKVFLIEKAKGILVRVTGDHFVFQTPVSQAGFCRKFLCPVNKTAIVANAIGSTFINKTSKYKLWRPAAGSKVILCPSAYYPHKNLELIFKVASLLKENARYDIRFILTIKSDDFDALSDRYPGVADVVSNIGPYNYSSALSVYEKADAVILPSLLETFSTVYIEAMALGLPLFVPRESFAEDICEGYGVYYDSLSEVSLFEALIHEEKESVGEGRQKIKESILEKYGTQETRYSILVSLFRDLVKKKKYSELSNDC